MELNPVLKSITESAQEESVPTHQASQQSASLQHQQVQIRPIRGRVLMKVKKPGEADETQRPKTRGQMSDYSSNASPNFLLNPMNNVSDNKSATFALKDKSLPLLGDRKFDPQLHLPNLKTGANEGLGQVPELGAKKKNLGRGIKLEGLDHNPTKYHLSRL